MKRIACTRTEMVPTEIRTVDYHERRGRNSRPVKVGEGYEIVKEIAVPKGMGVNFLSRNAPRVIAHANRIQNV